MVKLAAMYRLGARGLSLAAVTVALLAASSTAFARSGVIAGKLTGLSSGSQFAVVTAVNAQGVIAGMAAVGPGGSYSLSVKPGVYVVIGDTASTSGHPMEATGAPVRVRPGRHVRERTPLRKDKTGPKKNFAPDDSTARIATVAGSALPRGAVLTFQAYPTGDENTNVGDLGPDRQGVIANQMYAPCTKHGVVLVNTSPEFVTFAKQESALQRAGKLNSSTPFSFHPIKPQYTTSGGAVILDNNTGPTPDFPTVAEGNDDFADMNPPLDDSFITSTLITEVGALSAVACP
jgi:hypothetical protein